MPTLATLTQLKEELELGTTTAHDNALTLKLEIAEEAVIAHVKQRLGDEDEAAAWSDEVDAWDEDTVPKVVLGAVLTFACYLYKHRGDAHPSDTPAVDQNELPRSVTRLLARLRDPAIA